MPLVDLDGLGGAVRIYLLFVAPGLLLVKWPVVFLELAVEILFIWSEAHQHEIVVVLERDWRRVTQGVVDSLDGLVPPHVVFFAVFYLRFGVGQQTHPLNSHVVDGRVPVVLLLHLLLFILEHLALLLSLLGRIRRVTSLVEGSVWAECGRTRLIHFRVRCV